MKKIILASLLATSTMVNASDITLSKSIKSELRGKIENDLNVLNNLKFSSDTSNETLKLMGLGTLNSQTASDWLGERVNYVIEENALSLLKLLVKKVIFVERNYVTFPNANVLPYSLDPKNKAMNEEGGGVTVMSNIGAGLYLGGKQESMLYGMKISRGLLKKPIKVVVESPRAGIIQIGEGLFVSQLTVNNQNQNALANSINRLGTFFHEARHSDGNGESLAFAHSPCPTGHDLAGAYACDENLNGPYTVGAAMTTEMLKSCGDACSERDKEILKLIILDSQNRVMKTTHTGQPAVNWDPTPESL